MNEVWHHLQDPPIFFLHVYAELKTNQFDYKAHFPCFSPSHRLTFTCNSILNDISNQLIYDDYGQQMYPTTLLENIITYHSIIKHAHIDFPRGDLRYFPDPTDEYPYADYIDKLKESNYDRILTVEATAVKKEFFTEAKVCCEYLQLLLN